MAADRPYGEFYDFYSVSPENFESTLVYHNISFKKLPWNIIGNDVKNELTLPAFLTYIL